MNEHNNQGQLLKCKIPLARQCPVSLIYYVVVFGVTIRDVLPHFLFILSIRRVLLYFHELLCNNWKKKIPLTPQTL